MLAKVKAATNGQNADVAYDCAAHPSVQKMLLEVLRVQGTAVIVGSYKQPPEVDLLKVEFKELTLMGIRVYEKRDFAIAITILESAFLDFDLMLTALDPSKAAEIFPALLKGTEAIKVLFKF